MHTRSNRPSETFCVFKGFSGQNRKFATVFFNYLDSAGRFKPPPLATSDSLCPVSNKYKIPHPVTSFTTYGIVFSCCLLKNMQRSPTSTSLYFLPLPHAPATNSQSVKAPWVNTQPHSPLKCKCKRLQVFALQRQCHRCPQCVFIYLKRIKLCEVSS